MCGTKGAPTSWCGISLSGFMIQSLVIEPSTSLGFSILESLPNWIGSDSLEHPPPLVSAPNGLGIARRPLTSPVGIVRIESDDWKL